MGMRCPFRGRALVLCLGLQILKRGLRPEVGFQPQGEGGVVYQVGEWFLFLVGVEQRPEEGHDRWDCPIVRQIEHGQFS